MTQNIYANTPNNDTIIVATVTAIFVGTGGGGVSLQFSAKCANSSKQGP